MDIVGSFALILALITAGYAFIAGIVGIKTRNPLAIRSARRAGLAMLPLVTLSVGSIVWAFFTNNFSMAYVAEHSLADLIREADHWAGQEGSLLFWTWLLSIYAFLVLFLNRRKHPELMPYVGVIMAGVEFFFLMR